MIFASATYCGMRPMPMTYVMPDVFVVDEYVSVRENSSRTHAALRRSYRGQMMREMKTRSIDGLVKMAAGLSDTGSR